MDKQYLLKDFFSSGFYERYWGWQITEDDSVQLAEDVLELLKMSSGHLLDWCGGWGRVSIHLARKGFRISILDFIPEYLEKARNIFRQNNLELTTILADCRDTPADIQADAAICLFNSVGFMQDKEQVEALVRLHKTLKDGAKVVFDAMNLFFLAPYIDQIYETQRTDGKISRQRNDFDFYSSTMHSCFQIINPQGNVEAEKNFFQRMYTPADITGIIEKAGFTVKEIYGGFKREKISFNSPKIVIVAEK